MHQEHLVYVVTLPLIEQVCFQNITELCCMIDLEAAESFIHVLAGLLMPIFYVFLISYVICSLWFYFCVGILIYNLLKPSV